MAGLGSLAIDLTANTSRFERAMLRAERTAHKRTNRIQQTFKRFAGVAAASLGSIGIARVVGDFVNVAREFEQSIADLSSITGATGKDLKFLSDAAKEFGRTTTLSASQAATAFKLVASAKPDLLENADALKEVTAQTVLLAEASGLELVTAAEAVGQALNQFSAGAEQANRFVNVLAAGAKFGASEIGDTAEALKESGVIASGVGLTFEQLNAALQLIAQGGIKAGAAGTQLKNVLLRLATQSKSQFNPEIVGLQKAFENLAAAQLTTTQQSQLFGRLAVTSGKILINNASALGVMTEKLTDTNTAYEQAATRVDTFDGKIKRLKSAYEGFQLAITDTNTTLGKFVDWLSKAINGTNDFITALSTDAEGLESFDMAIEAISRKIEFLRTNIEKGLFSRGYTQEASEELIQLERLMIRLKKQRDDFAKGPALIDQNSSGFMGPKQPSEEVKREMELSLKQAKKLQTLLSRLYPEEVKLDAFFEAKALLQSSSLEAGELSEAMRRLQAEFDGVNAKAINTTKLLSRLFPESDRARKFALELKALETAAIGPEKMAAAIKKLREEYDKLKPESKLYEELFPNEKLAIEFQKDIELLGKLNLPADKASEAVKRLQKSFADATGGPRKLSNAAEESASAIKSAIEDAAAGIESSITDAVLASTLSLESLGDLANSILKQIARSFIQAQIVSPIVSGFSGAFTPAPATTSTNTSDFGPVQPRASGGPVGAGRTYLIGEDGPELLHMGGAAGNVIANGRFGGGGTVVNVTNNTSSNAKVTRSNGANGMELVNIVIGELIADTARGGPFSNNLSSQFGLHRKGVMRT